MKVKSSSSSSSNGDIEDSGSKHDGSKGSAHPGNTSYEQHQMATVDTDEEWDESPSVIIDTELQRHSLSKIIFEELAFSGRTNADFAIKESKTW